MDPFEGACVIFVLSGYDADSHLQTQNLVLFVLVSRQESVTGAGQVVL